MKTVELDACRNELARDILATDNMEVLRTVRRAYRRAVDRAKLRAERLKVEELAPYTVEELDARIDEAETEFEAGKGVAAEVAHQRMKQFIAGL
ncbi:MAG: hypothetical protein Q4F50_18235 [Bacteroides sp.]|uniref:hypothetical protein n=1 Tax=Bacteroides sp. TaxID=29523 RepID=UPI0026E01BA5|nr:hypothetical protein [Bacteroides sp.]MDO5421971.1 hypothetical protein [Bacteroides sp.]